MNTDSKLTDRITELSCNVDDMSAEQIAFAMERLFEGGARDVYTIPIGMKKSRTGTLIRVLCAEAEKERMIALLFKHTTTIGIREALMQRYILDRSIETKQTSLGSVRIKRSEGYGVRRCKYEYEDLARIAKENRLSIQDTVLLLDRELKP